MIICCYPIDQWVNKCNEKPHYSMRDAHERSNKNAQTMENEQNSNSEVVQRVLFSPNPIERENVELIVND